MAGGAGDGGRRQRWLVVAVVVSWQALSHGYASELGTLRWTWESMITRSTDKMSLPSDARTANFTKRTSFPVNCATQAGTSLQISATSTQ